MIKTLRAEVNQFNAARKASITPCHCDAYQFPHRKLSGGCKAPITQSTNSRASWQIEADDAGVSDKDFMPC